MSKAIAGISIFILLVGGVAAMKMWQYNSCRGDGLSAGTCLGMISK